MPGYNLYRAICNLTRADDFNGLRREIAPPVIERLRRTYAHVDDVDLFTGTKFSFQNLKEKLIDFLNLSKYYFDIFRWSG